MRILIVEDDPTTSRSIELMLTDAGLNVYTTDLGEEAIDLVKLYDYDLITLDINLPDMSGLEVLRQLRAAQINTPIVMLTGDPTAQTKIKAFGFGADDYIEKPFHREELLARIHAITRRFNGQATSKFQMAGLEVDLEKKTVTINGKTVHLTLREYTMLELLVMRPGTTLTKEMFLNHMYGGLDEPELKIIDVFICKLRKKLSEMDGNNYIQTVWGRGYRLSQESELDIEPDRRGKQYVKPQ